MKHILSLTLLLAASMAGAQLEAIRTLTPEQGQEVRRPVEEKVFASTQKELPALEAELLEIFQSSETTLEGKQYACRMLRYCASEASVPVLAPELTNPELEETMNLALESGALAGKVSGAGGGGFMMLMVDPSDRIMLETALKTRPGHLLPFRFSAEGAQSWTATT